MGLEASLPSKAESWAGEMGSSYMSACLGRSMHTFGGARFVAGADMTDADLDLSNGYICQERSRVPTVWAILAFPSAWTAA